jgi:hypothetical protein
MIMNKRTVCGMLLALGLLVSLGAQAAIVPWTATLDGAQEVPPNSGLATGSAFGTLDDISGLLSWNIVFDGLSGPATAMHFHGPAAPGINASVVVNVGAISGLNSPSIGSATIVGTQMSQFLANSWYLNIHTVAFPGGEIRGQVITGTAVPEPATLGLVGLALLVVAATRRRAA